MADLRALTAAATPGPWNADGLTLRPGTIWDTQGDDIARAWEQADASLIVAAVNALPALLDVMDAARATFDSAVLVPMEREDDDDGPAEFWCVHPAPLAALREALDGLIGSRR